MKYIDSFLNKFTMYKFTMYYLLVIIGMAVIFSFFKIILYNPLDILLSTILAVISCYIFNWIFSVIFKAPTSSDSAIITALILVLLIPTKFPMNATFILLASFLAMASKYFATIDKHHLFNPAAVSLAAIALLSPEHSAIWWVGTTPLMPFIVIGGLLLMRKIQRESMVITFFISYFIILGAIAIFKNESILTLWQKSILESSLFFLGFVMLTEPLTSPATKIKRIYYAIFVSILFATPQINLFNFSLTPELALCVGNVFSYIISPFQRLELFLKEKRQIAYDTYEFAFEKPKKFAFIPGQYMEWTLPHNDVDLRGNRRYFSLSSGPLDNEISIAVRFYTPPSSFKKNLLDLNGDKKIIASQVAGDFTLSKDLDKPLVFIAGGIGIAPFKSMIKNIMDKKLKANIILLYANRHIEDIAYKNLLDQAEKFGIKTIYTLTDVKSTPKDWKSETGYVNENLIKREIPDFKNRIFYISGPQLMVDNFKEILGKIGVKRKNIKSDFFPGYNESK